MKERVRERGRRENTENDGEQVESKKNSFLKNNFPGKFDVSKVSTTNNWKRGLIEKKVVNIGKE